MIDPISRVPAGFSVTVWRGVFSADDFPFAGSRTSLDLDFFADFDLVIDLDDFGGGGGRFLELELFGIKAA